MLPAVSPPSTEPSMSKLASIKVSSTLVESAKAEASLFQRSAGGQVEHWARLGRALESSPDFDHNRLREALTGIGDASALTAEERVAFLEVYGNVLARPLPEEEQFWEERRKGGLGVGMDGRGKLVRGSPGGDEKEVTAKRRARA
jgi:hypothetical protein